jgi:hypothetical protein
MHKGQACSFGFDLWTKSGELGDRLAAKRSTEMAQKYEEKRMVDREVFDDISTLRTIGFQELRIYALCLEHGKLIFTDSGSRGNRFRGCAMADSRRSFDVSHAPGLITRPDWRMISSVCSRSGVRV